MKLFKIKFELIMSYFVYYSILEQKQQNQEHTQNYQAH